LQSLWGTKLITDIQTLIRSKMFPTDLTLELLEIVSRDDWVEELIDKIGCLSEIPVLPIDATYPDRVKVSIGSVSFMANIDPEYKK
jgi:hypothetical protein